MQPPPKGRSQTRQTKNRKQITWFHRKPVRKKKEPHNLAGKLTARVQGHRVSQMPSTPPSDPYTKEKEETTAYLLLQVTASAKEGL